MNYFSMDNVVDRVHACWTGAGARDPPWTDGGALTGVWPPATLVHESSPAGAQQIEGCTGSSTRASPGLGRRCGGRATVGKWQRRESLVTAVLKLRERGKSAVGRCGDLRERGGQFIGPEGVRQGGEFGNFWWRKLKRGRGIRGRNGDYSRD
jgi:hypothetical protein